MSEPSDKRDFDEDEIGASKELRILVTDYDKSGTDIAKMSNFLDAYIGELTASISDESLSDFIGDIPAADFSIMLESISVAEAVFTESYSFVLDYDSLPADVKSKLKSGEYKLGPSRQVKGNSRAVVVDSEGTRVKDITLKETRETPDLARNMQSIAEQIQMRQIYQKLDEVQQLQLYQIDRDRDRDITTPFLNARDFILRAQLSEDFKERERLLRLADTELTKALNGVYTDIETTAQHLASATRFPVFQNGKRIQGFIRTLATDLQYATQFAGVQMHVLDYLGDNSSSLAVLQNYQRRLRAFSCEPIGSSGLSAALLMHRSSKYPEGAMDYWYDFARHVEDLPVPDIDHLGGRSVLLLEVVEPDEDEDVDE